MQPLNLIVEGLLSETDQIPLRDGDGLPKMLKPDIHPKVRYQETLLAAVGQKLHLHKINK